MPEELSPADRSSLAAEQGPVNMSVGGLMVFAAQPALNRQMVARRIGERIHLIPRLRQRLEEPPLGLANPVWTDDTAFDLDWHVRQAGLAPGRATRSSARWSGASSRTAWTVAGRCGKRR